MDRRKRYKTYFVDYLKSVPHITIHRWKKAKNRASCQNLDQNNASDQSNEEQINQNEYQSEGDESFSGFSSYYSRGTSVDCELEGGGETLEHGTSKDNGASLGSNDENNSQFDDYINNDKWKSPLFTGCKLNLLHVIIMIGTFVARYSLTNDALQHY